MSGPNECQCGGLGGLWKPSVTLPQGRILSRTLQEAVLSETLEEQSMPVMVKPGSPLKAEVYTAQGP